MPQRKLVVIIPCYNKVFWTQKTIESLIACTKSDLHIIIVNDNSTDDTAIYCHELTGRLNAVTTHFWAHQNTENKGVTAAWNTGLDIAMATEMPYICIANNDLLFTNGWDTPLLDALDGEYSLVSPYSTEGKVTPADWPMGAQKHVNPVGLGILGACFAFKPELIRQIGNFPPSLKHFYNDNFIIDMCRKKDLKYGHIQESYIHHFWCTSTKDLDNKWFYLDKAAYSKYWEEMNKKTVETKKITIGFRLRFPDIYSKHLSHSISNLKGEFDIIGIGNTQIKDFSDFQSTKYPADNYNEIIDKASTPYVLLVHEDIIFTPDILESIENTITQHPDFGAIGLVGALHEGGNKWSEEGQSFEVDTLDSCCILIRKDLGLKFNSEVFDELHCYVEDMCGQIKSLGKKVYTINYKVGSKMDHCSTTWNKLGGSWGNYPRYREMFGKMYPELKTT